jgi:hypothetical protein
MTLASKMAKVATHKSARVALRTKVTMDSDDVAAWNDIQQRSLLSSASRGVSTTKKVGGSRKGNCSISGRATRMRQVAHRVDSSADEDSPEVVEQNETLPDLAEWYDRKLSSSDEESHSSAVVNPQGREPNKKLDSNRNVSVAQRTRQFRIDRPRSASCWRETGDDCARKRSRSASRWRETSKDCATTEQRSASCWRETGDKLATTEHRSASRGRETDDSRMTGRKPQSDLDGRTRRQVRRSFSADQYHNQSPNRLDDYRRTRPDVDLAGRHPLSCQGAMYILTVLDAVTRYLIAVPLKNKSALTVAEALVKNVFLLFGSLVSDQGTEFCDVILVEVGNGNDSRNHADTPAATANGSHADLPAVAVNGSHAGPLPADNSDVLIAGSSKHKHAYDLRPATVRRQANRLRHLIRNSTSRRVRSFVEMTRRKVRTLEQKVKRKQREQRPRGCPYCTHAPFTSASGFRDHVILVHQRYCSWSGIVRPFVNKEEERLAVDGVLRNSGRRPRFVVSDEPCEGAASTATASSEVHEAGRLFRLQSEPMEACASKLDTLTPCAHSILAELFYDTSTGSKFGQNINCYTVRSASVGAASSVNINGGPSVTAPALDTLDSVDTTSFSSCDNMFAEIVGAMLAVNQLPPYSGSLLPSAPVAVATPVYEDISPVAVTPPFDADCSAVIAPALSEFDLYVDFGQQPAVDAAAFDLMGAFGDRPSSGVAVNPLPSSSSTNETCAVLTGSSTIGSVATDAVTAPSDVSASVGVASSVSMMPPLFSYDNNGVQSSSSVEPSVRVEPQPRRATATQTPLAETLYLPDDISIDSLIRLLHASPEASVTELLLGLTRGRPEPVPDQQDGYCWLSTSGRGHGRTATNQAGFGATAGNFTSW